MDDFTGKDFGRYHILEQLGEGGMAIVYKAFDTQLERDVAVKVIRKDAFPLAAQERMLKRFEREAKSQAKMSHPNIVKIFDSGVFEGSPYLVMEYIPSGTLRQFTGKPMSYREAARLLAPVAKALAFAHEQGIIHRDVKPANILLGKHGEAMLTDFGVAKLLELDEAHTMTGTNMGVGTPEYMAPEQWLNKISAQTDIYALGVVFYELVTGRRPFTADTPAAVMMKQMHDPLPRADFLVKGLPDSVNRVLMKAIARKTEDRYTTMTAFSGALEKITEERKSTKNPSKYKLWFGGFGLLILAAIIFYSFGIIKFGGGKEIASTQTLSPSLANSFTKIPLVLIGTATPLPNSEVVAGSVVTYLENFDQHKPHSWELKGSISFSNDQMVMGNMSGAYFSKVLSENQTVLVRFKYSKESAFSFVIHNEESWGGYTFKKLGIYNSEPGKPFFLAVMEGTEYKANDTWWTGPLIPEPNTWYYLLIHIGGKDDFILRVWDANNPQEYMEMRNKMKSDWIQPGWHFRIFTDDGQVTVEDYQELIIQQ